MSFQHRSTPFGPFEQHIISRPESGCSLALVPGHGACVLDLQLRGVSILDGYQTPEELQVNRGAKNTVLFPFPNRLKDGRYEWEGNYYFFSDKRRRYAYRFTRIWNGQTHASVGYSL